MSQAIFLGAGASHADGAPLQDKLFSDYFRHLQGNHDHAECDKSMVKLFSELFDIDVTSDLKGVSFPTFEEVIGILDNAYLKKEQFLFQEDNKTFYKVDDLKANINKLISVILKNSLINSKSVHETLITNLIKEKTLSDTIFLTTNYDILADNAISNNIGPYSIDYGFKFSFPSEEPYIAKLYKLHGSLNWMVCPVCNQILLTPYSKNIDNRACTECGSSYMRPVIIAPSYQKDLAYPHLTQLWYSAEESLRKIDHLIFCGYSFPDADIHVKYLMKRIQKCNRKKPLRFTVINFYDGKSEDKMSEEMSRFYRFLGKNCVDYRRNSFTEFAQNPHSFFYESIQI